MNIHYPLLLILSSLNIFSGKTFIEVVNKIAYPEREMILYDPIDIFETKINLSDINQDIIYHPEDTFFLLSNTAYHTLWGGAKCSQSEEMTFSDDEGTFSYKETYIIDPQYTYLFLDKKNNKCFLIMYLYPMDMTNGSTIKRSNEKVKGYIFLIQELDTGYPYSLKMSIGIDRDSGDFLDLSIHDPDCEYEQDLYGCKKTVTFPDEEAKGYNIFKISEHEFYGLYSKYQSFLYKSQDTVTSASESEDICRFYYNDILKMNIYNKVEVYPQYIDKEGEFLKYATSNLPFSEEGEFTTCISVIVDENGKPLSYLINNKKEEEYFLFEQEISNRLQKMGSWHPARCGGVNVPSTYAVCTRIAARVLPLIPPPN